MESSRRMPTKSLLEAGLVRVHRHRAHCSEPGCSLSLLLRRWTASFDAMARGATLRQLGCGAGTKMRVKWPSALPASAWLPSRDERWGSASPPCCPHRLDCRAGMHVGGLGVPRSARIRLTADAGRTWGAVRSPYHRHALDCLAGMHVGGLGVPRSARPRICLTADAGRMRGVVRPPYYPHRLDCRSGITMGVGRPPAGPLVA